MAQVRHYYKQQYTLEELQGIVRQGKAAEFITPGDQIGVIFDGKEVWYDVIGLDKEKLVNPDLKHSITIQAHTLIEERCFDDTYPYGKNVWGKSKLREYLNSEEYKARYADLVPYLAEVNVEENGVETQDLFFLLSEDDYDPDKTKYYPYYNGEIKNVKADEEGYTSPHWTRSANRGGACNVWSVYSSGYVGGYSASYAYRCAPACVIA